MAHPHLMRLAFLPQAVEQTAAVGNLDKGAAEFAALLAAALDRAAELLGQGLLAIAGPIGGLRPAPAGCRPR
jgi:hypothetical protein